jgi:hypothetical protein
MQGDIALAGFMLTAEEWNALDAPSRALLIAVATKPEDLAKLELHETPVEMPVFPVGSAPISDEKPAD